MFDMTMAAPQERFTREEFERLPYLVSRSVVLAWTGLNKRDLRRLIESGQVQVCRFRKGGYGKFRKQSIAELCGIRDSRDAWDEKDK